MQKIAYIIIFISFASCSVFKQQNSGGKLLSEKEEYPVNIIEEIRSLNISSQSYFIQKAEVQIISGGEKESFLASVKFLFPDKYLISLRSKSGVEGARILLTSDTILVNDRISRKLLYGDPDFISRKFGISSSVLPVFFGDFVFNILEDKENVNCLNGFINLHSSIAGKRYDSVIDCKVLKMSSCIQNNDMDEEMVVFNYSRYLKVENRIIPTKIKLEYKNVQVLISIRNIEIPWEGEIEFIPGYKYEVIPLK